MKSSRWLALVLVLGIAWVGGCKNDQPYQSTRIDLGAASPQPIIGWSTTLGRLVQEQCFSYDLVDAGDFQTDTSFSVAKSSSQESHTFGVDTSVSAKVKLFSASDKFSYVNNSDESAMSVAMWFNADSGGTLQISNVQLSDVGQKAAKQGGAYFGLVCGDKVITSFPVLLSTRFNINFQSSSYSDATDISNKVKAGYSFVQVSNQIKNDFSDSSSQKTLQIQYATVGNPDLFDPSYISKADEATCYNSGDCSEYAADLISQFSNAAKLAGQQLTQDIDNFNTIYYIDYPQLLSEPGNFMEAIMVPGVPGDTLDPYADHKDIINNAVNVYADLLLAAQAMQYISSNSSVFGADSQTLLAVNDYQAVLNKYATTLFSQIDSCFADHTTCSAIAADTSIFNFIAADITLDSATQNALKSTVQALIYDVSTQAIGDMLCFTDWVTVWNNNFPQKFVYLTTFGPDSNGLNYNTVAATLNTIGAFTKNISAGGAIFPLTALSFDENTLLPSAGTFPSTTYQYIDTAVYQNNSAGRANGTDSYQFLISPPRAIDFSLMYQANNGIDVYEEFSVQLSFVPRLDYLPTINPFYQSAAAQQGVSGQLLK